jgi:hypothetical protein
MEEERNLPFELPAVARKKLVEFDAGILRSDAEVLLLRGIDGLAFGTAAGVHARSARSNALRPPVGEVLGLRMFAIAAATKTPMTAPRLKHDPVFKMAVGRLPETGYPLCSQPTLSRLENMPSGVALLRMMAAMIDQFCASYRHAPSSITIDIDDTLDTVHRQQQLSLFNTHYENDRRPTRRPPTVGLSNPSPSPMNMEAGAWWHYPP